MKKIARVKPNNSTNRVTINIYVESPAKQHLIHRKTTTTKPTTNKLNPFWKMAHQSARPQHSYGYDRRAQLLAYARELREGDDPQQVRWRPTRPQKRSKDREWSNVKALRIPASIRRLFRGTGRKCGYERIETEETSQVVDQMCSRPKSKFTRKSTNYAEGTKSSTTTSYCEKLKCMLREVSAGLLCCKIPAEGKQKRK